MHVSRNYTYFKAMKYLDHMAVIMLASVAAVDVLPTGTILVGAVIASIAYNTWITSGRAKIEFSEELDVLKNKRGVAAARFYVAPPEATDAYVDGYLGTPIVFVPYVKLNTTPKRLRSILCHERAHTSSADSLARFIYENGAKYILLTAIGWPFAVIYFIVTQGAFPWPLIPLALLYAPYFYFAYTKKNFLHRREYFADLEAERALGEEYRSFLNLAKQRKKHTKGGSEDVGSDTHPSFEDRVAVVNGDFVIQKSSLFILGLLSALSAAFVFAALALNVTYFPECNAFNPDCEPVSRFEFFTFSLAAFVFLYWFSRYLKILRSILAVGRNGLNLGDAAAFLLGLCLGWIPCSTILLLGYFGYNPAYGWMGVLVGSTFYYIVSLSFNVLLIILVSLSAYLDEVGIHHVLTPYLVALSIPFLYLSTLDETFRLLGAFGVLVNLAIIGVIADLLYCCVGGIYRKLCGRAVYRLQWQ